MVTKGHDLPRVTLVGVLNADAALSFPDFQAEERTFQLLVQVAGRAGRAEHRGTVLIQTRNPEHMAIHYAQTHDVAGFSEAALAERREMHYPPYSRLVLVRVDSLDAKLAEATAARLAREAQLHHPGAEILGPAPAPLARLRNRHRFRFLIRAPGRAAVRKAVLTVLAQPVDRRVRIDVDIDPVNML
jgi:primosomal protein N' (replication factor Y)